MDKDLHNNLEFETRTIIKQFITDSKIYKLRMYIDDHDNDPRGYKKKISTRYFVEIEDKNAFMGHDYKAFQCNDLENAHLLFHYFLELEGDEHQLHQSHIFTDK